MEPASPPTELPSLARPGAGLPWAEALMCRYYIGPFVAARSDWDKNWQTFDRINAKIIALAESLSDEQMITRILVPRLQGIEDSSRYWSVAMTLEHLVIVGNGITAIVKSLGQNIVPPVKVNIGAMKPKGGHEPSSDLNDFRRFSSTTRTTIEQAIRLPVSRMHTLDHPWFGAFDALEWQWVMATHSVIHYRQIKAIVAQLR